MPPSKILLTGSSGFVGSHVIKTFHKSFELHAISTKSKHITNVKTVYSWDQIDTISASFDAVIHMAGLAHDTQNKNDETAYFDVNVGLTEKLLERLQQWNTKTFIYLSSVKAAVDSTSSVLLNETIQSTAQNVYGRSKRKAEEVIMASRSPANKIILRPVMIYGRGQKGNLNALERLVHKGIWFPFKNWKNRRSVLSVHNLTSTIQSIVIKSVPPGVYYIADDSPVSTVDILEAIGLGTNQKVRFIGLPNGMIKLGLKILPKKLKSITDKIFGSLEVDNSKLKTALGTSTMPHNTATDLPRAFKTSSSNA